MNLRIMVVASIVAVLLLTEITVVSASDSDGEHGWHAMDTYGMGVSYPLLFSVSRGISCPLAILKKIRRGAFPAFLHCI